VRLRGAHTIPIDTPLVRVSPADVVTTAIVPDAGALAIRVLNTSARPVRARLLPHRGCQAAQAIDPLGRDVAMPVIEVVDGAAVFDLRPWQLATVRFR
jgi:hypothetical protein